MEAADASLGGFDAVVDVNGSGDYTSIASAFGDGNARVLVLPGTYNETAIIDLPDGGALVGQGQVIIDFGDVASRFVRSDGTGVVTIAGTVSTTASSATVTGSGTSFQTDGLTAGDAFWIDDLGWFEIASVASDTSLTLTRVVATAVSGRGYVGMTANRNVRVENVTIEGFTNTGLQFDQCVDFVIRDVICGEPDSSVAFRFTRCGGFFCNLVAGSDGVQFSGSHGVTGIGLTLQNGDETGSSTGVIAAGFPSSYISISQMALLGARQAVNISGGSHFDLDIVAINGLALLNQFGCDESRLRIVARGGTTTGRTISVGGDNCVINADLDGGGIQGAGTNRRVIGASAYTQGPDLVVFPAELDNGNESGTFLLDWNAGQKQRATLTGNITTLTITDPPGPCNVLLKLIQDGTGGRTVTWPASVLWPNGQAPTLSTGANAVDIISFYFDGTDYYAVPSFNFS
jgi:hypothetical protein